MPSERSDHAGFDLRITPVDSANLDAVRAAVTNRTRLVWLETPTNPRLIVSDIQAIADIAHRHGALVVVDNTFATPVLQQPFSLGADLVVHSVTKYLAGHSDLIQGAALARDAARFEPIKFLQNAIGAVPAPLDWSARLTRRGCSKPWASRSIPATSPTARRSKQRALGLRESALGH